MSLQWKRLERVRKCMTKAYQRLCFDLTQLDLASAEMKRPGVHEACKQGFTALDDCAKGVKDLRVGVKSLQVDNESEKRTREEND